MKVNVMVNVKVKVEVNVTGVISSSSDCGSSNATAGSIWQTRWMKQMMFCVVQRERAFKRSENLG